MYVFLLGHAGVMVGHLTWIITSSANSQSAAA